MKLALLLFFAGLFLLGVGALVWTALDLPPVKYVVAHGFPPAGGPTGRRVTVEGVEFVEIGAGYFRMGSRLDATNGDALGRICKVFHLPWGRQPLEGGNEAPVHWVRIARPYWMAVTGVTNAQYERFDPEHERGEDSRTDAGPVTEMSWEDARRYCEWLSARGPLQVRLPSESERENAARAGSPAEYCFGDDEGRLGEYAWFFDSAGGRAREAATRRANAWGLFDLHGNAWEWCKDRWHDDHEGAPGDGTAWTEGSSPLRVLRGGSWRLPAVRCRSAVRCGYVPSARRSQFGFRPAASSR